MFYRNILDTIGRTPLVRINKLAPEGAEIYAKIEGVNPGGSIKDRIALRMIQAAEASGELLPGKTIIEATSGNTGIALAMIGTIKGYEVEIVMSEAVSVERRKIIKAFGAKTTLTAGDQGTDGAIRKVRELVAANPNKYYHTDQYSSESNKLAHYETTAREIWEQTGGELDCFTAAIGTSGTLMGVGTYLKKLNPRIKIISAEPEKGHYIQGLKNMEEAIVPAIYDKSKLDGIIMINTEEAYEMSRKIAAKEGIFAGMSSGAALLAAVQAAKKYETKRIITIFPDRGEKYLSTKLFD
jgi:S-sulfo-L-cysteine synthase (O-acetyl-L-serine-dependent)